MPAKSARCIPGMSRAKSVAALIATTYFKKNAAFHAFFLFCRSRATTMMRRVRRPAADKENTCRALNRCIPGAAWAWRISRRTSRNARICANFFARPSPMPWQRRRRSGPAGELKRRQGSTAKHPCRHANAASVTARTPTPRGDNLATSQGTRGWKANRPLWAAGRHARLAAALSDLRLRAARHSRRAPATR